MVIRTPTPQGALSPKLDVFGNVFTPVCNKLDLEGPPDPATCAPPDPINPKFGRENATFYMGNSFYHALELQLVQRMSHGLQVQGAYTWSKSIDNNSATMAGAQLGHMSAFL